MIAPRQMWAVAASQASLRGEDLGPVGPLPRQPGSATSGCPSAASSWSARDTSRRSTPAATAGRRKGAQSARDAGGGCIRRGDHYQVAYRGTGHQRPTISVTAKRRTPRSRARTSVGCGAGSGAEHGHRRRRRRGSAPAISGGACRCRWCLRVRTPPGGCAVGAAHGGPGGQPAAVSCAVHASRMCAAAAAARPAVPVADRPAVRDGADGAAPPRVR